MAHIMHAQRRGQSFADIAQNLGGRKLSSVPAKPLGFCHVWRVERTPPTIVIHTLLIRVTLRREASAKAAALPLT